MAKFTDDELEMLSEEERAAIADDQEPKSVEELRAIEEADAAAAAREAGAGAAVRSRDNEPVKTDDEIAAEAVLSKQDVKEDAEIDPSEEEKIAAEIKAAAEAELAAKEEAEFVAKEAAIISSKVADAISPKSAPAFVLEAEKKHGSTAEIEAKMKALDDKFEDGDINLAEYNKSRAEFVESLTEMKMFDKINNQVQKAASERSWKDSQAQFFGNNPEYSLERIKNVAIVDAVNRLLADDESKQLTDAQIFELAKKECDSVFYPNGRQQSGNVVSLDDKRKEVDAAKVADAAKVEAQQKALSAVQKAEAAKSAAVKTLAKVPVSESNAIIDDKFAAIDKLSGDAYELAVAQLSNTDRATYAAL